MIHYCACGKALGDGERVYNGGVCTPCKRPRRKANRRTDRVPAIRAPR